MVSRAPLTRQPTISSCTRRVTVLYATLIHLLLNKTVSGYFSSVPLARTRQYRSFHLPRESIVRERSGSNASRLGSRVFLYSSSGSGGSSNSGSPIGGGENSPSGSPRKGSKSASVGKKNSPTRTDSSSRGRGSNLGAIKPPSNSGARVQDTAPWSSTTTDVLILGSGPTARAIASLLSESKKVTASQLDVVVADENFDKEWVPNYGVWEDEWEAIAEMYETHADLNVRGCINRRWGVTDCYFGGSFDIPAEERFRIQRPYLRVDRSDLRKMLSPKEGAEEEGINFPSYRVIRGNHVVSRCLATNLYSPSDAVTHDETGSTVLLSDGSVVRTKLIVDCTGHESKLTRKDQRATDKPGYQIAYGAMVTVEENDVNAESIGPYDKEAMTLFDYRTDHFAPASEALESAEASPTFMYAMPIKGNKIFFEETSLVARPALSFHKCKERYMKRLDYLGIKVLHVEEEEFCYIPMGGALPEKGQRVIGLGGACATVHPSTGYHLCRMMASARDVALVLENELSLPDFNPDRAAASAYHAVWSPGNIRQRNFAVFGGEFLMKQNVEGLRGFFDGFFRLPLEMWGGFLAGWPGLPNNTAHETWSARLWFGLTFVSKLPLKVAIDMFLSIVAYSVSEGVPLPQSVTPLLGNPESYEWVEKPEQVGDIAAKTEAREMIAASKVGQEIPVAFDTFPK